MSQNGDQKKKKKVVANGLKMVQFSEKINKKNYQKLTLVTLVTLVTKVLTLPLLGRRDSQRRDDIE